MKVNLESWLDDNFPGQYEVVSSVRDLQPRYFIEKKMTSVVADKKDPEVQCVFDWYKDKDEFGLTVDLVQKAFDQCRKETALSRELFQDFTHNGAGEVAVSIVEDAAYFLIYVEPSVENRSKYLQYVLHTLDHQKEHSTSIWIEFMEDSVYHKVFKDIIPKGYWHRIDNYHQRYKTVSLEFQWSPDLSKDELMSHWVVNTESDRFRVYNDDAYQSALRWADKKISPPFYLEPYQFVQYDIDQNDSMAIHFYFPFYDSKPDENDEDLDSKRRGYVTGLYQVDKKNFSDIKSVKEL